MSHYDDEALFQYAEGTSPIAGEIESHVASCDRCTSEIGSHRQIVDALRTEDVWSAPSPAPRQFVVDVVAFAERARLEDESAVTLCDEILSGPSAWWPQRLRRCDNVYTAGMARQLLERMRQMLTISPANALQVTSMAIEIANGLDVIEYPCDYVVKLRAQAYRDHAYVLSFMGRYPEALDFADRAKRLFDQVPLPEYDLARLALVRASILRDIDRVPEAVSLAHEAAETFLRFGDRHRYVNARMTEGGMIYHSGDVTAALEIFNSIVSDPALESVTRIGVINNIAVCYRDMGQLDTAAEHLRRCIDEYKMLGIETERTRARRNLGQTLVRAGRYVDAIPVLRETWKEFEQLELFADAGLAALELAEALLLQGEPAEVPAICRNIVSRFTRAGMTSRAITALSFLREAVALGQANASLVRHVHDFLRELPAERPRLFATPPGGSQEG